MSPSGWPLFAAVLGLALAGCVLSPIDATGRECPCATGWRCVDGRCERCPSDQPCERDAGSMDAGTDASVDASTDTGTDTGTDAAAMLDAGPASLCESSVPGRIWCSGFEGSVAEEWTRIDWSPRGRVEVVTSPVHRGRSAGLVAGESGGGAGFYRFNREGLTHSPSAESLHLSFWIWRSEHAQSGPVLFIRLRTMGGEGSYLDLTLHPDGTVEPEYRDSGGGTTVRFPAQSDLSIAPGAWTCVRVEVLLDAAGDLRLWQGDTAGSEVERDVTWLSGSPDLTGDVFDRLYVGLTSTAEDAMLVFDDVALGTEIQPCW